MQASLERLRQRREELGSEGGFTLIELLIVIVILGILAAIVVFAVQNLTQQSATAACQGNYKTVETALEAYKAQTGAYPAGATTAAVITELQGAATGQDGSTDGPWLKDTPPIATTDPYYFTIDTAGNISVATVKANGAKADAAAAPGSTNCATA